jgi:hypothetical protein
MTEECCTIVEYVKCGRRGEGREGDGLAGDEMKQMGEDWTETCLQRQYAPSVSVYNKK